MSDHVPKVSRDSDDERVLACALAARVDAIVSGDADPLDPKSFQSIPILTSPLPYASSSANY